MPLAVVTAISEEVNVSMVEHAAEEVEEDVDKVKDDKDKKFVEEAAVHINTDFTSQMPHITLKINSGPHSQMIQEKG